MSELAGAAAGLRGRERVRDLAGHERVVVGTPVSGRLRRRARSSAACRSAAWPCSRPTPSTGWPAMCRTGRRAAAVRAEAPAAGQAVGGHVLRSRAGAGGAARARGAHARCVGAAAARRGDGAVAQPAGRFPLACGEDPATLGVRVPVIDAPAGVRWPVLQSSANLAGGPEARELAEVPEAIRRAADMVIDGGELPGTASTVVDLRAFETDGEWRIVRRGAVEERDVRAALEWQFHFDPATYPSDDPRGHPGLRPAPGRGGGRMWRRVRARAGAGDRDGGDGAGWCSGDRRPSCWASTRARRCSRSRRSRLGAAGAIGRGPAAGRAARGAVRSGGQRALRPPSRRRREAVAV